MNTPGLGPAIQKAFSGIVGTINDASQWSVRPAAILQEYRRFGHADISTLAEVYDLDLSAVDRAIGWLDTKWYRPSGGRRSGRGFRFHAYDRPCRYPS